jgi:2-amino-4-hydroxy-6-hydroxymethyldihydropteridine diphosphokinase
VPQGKFLNAAAEAETNLAPQDLRTTVKAIEKNLGRQETVPNGPRVIDIDILLYDRITVNTPNLTIPHPRMCERDFVMIPLKEIAPLIAKELAYADHNKR